MPAFLDRPDYYTTINLTVLDTLVGGDTSIITELSLEAIEEMKSYLVSHYDVDAIFSAALATRNKTVLMYCKDIGLYHIFSLYSIRRMPAIREQRYKNAMQWLVNVSEQKLSPVGLPLNTNPESAFVKTGGNEKRINHQQ